MKHLIYTLIAVFIFSSCTISIDLTIHPDHSGTYALGVQYSDSLRSFMGNSEETNSKLESEIMSDEMKENYPSNLELPEFIETDTSAALVFKFNNLEELDQIFLAMKEGPEADQSIVNKGKKYIYSFKNKSEDQKEEDENDREVLDMKSMFENVQFEYRFHFPERNIVKVKKVEDFEILENGSKMIYSLPLNDVEKKPVIIQMKVK